MRIVRQSLSFEGIFRHKRFGYKTKFYAARLLDQDKLRQSRSGGVFVAFSDYVLSNGGVVYGAGYKEKGFLYVAKRYGNWGIRYKIENIKNRIKRKFKL